MTNSLLVRILRNCGLCVLFLSLGEGLSPWSIASASAPGEFLRIIVKDAKTTVDASDVSLRRTLRELAQNADLHITLPDCADRTISGHFEAAQPGILLRQLSEKCGISTKSDATKPTATPGTAAPASQNSPATHPLALLTLDTSPRQAVASSQGIHSVEKRPRFRPHQLIVQWKKDATATQRKKLLRKLGCASLSRRAGNNLELVRLPDGLNEDKAAVLYEASGLVETAEKNFLRYPQQTVPNDPAFTQQWGFQKAMLPKVWDYVRGNKKNLIAVLDTGINASHPDLENNIWTNQAEVNGQPGVDDDGNGYVDDFQGWDFGGSDINDVNGDNDPVGTDPHATLVAGIIAASGNNGVATAGMLWQARLINIKLSPDNYNSMDTYAIVSGINYVLAIPGVRIVNCSFGGPDPSTLESEAFARLRDAGILAVCAAGNSGCNLDQDQNCTNYPSGYQLPNIVAVASSDRNDAIASYSNYGKNSVQLLAPGDQITSTAPPSSTVAEVKTPQLDLSALGMEFSVITDGQGISGRLIDCGIGAPGDFQAKVAGNIALIQRGTLYFRDKAANAEAAGAKGVVIYNNTVDDFDTYGGTLGYPGISIPVVSVTRPQGDQLEKQLELGDVQATVIDRLSDVQPLTMEESGTSFAAPFVCGIAGLLLAVRPDLTAAELKDILANTADPLPLIADKIGSGGRVNAWSALKRIWPINDLFPILKTLVGQPGTPSGITEINGDGYLGLSEAIMSIKQTVPAQ